MKRRQIVLAIAACLLWSTAFVGVKVVLRYMPPFTVAGVRFILAGAMQWLICRPGDLLQSVRHRPRAVLVVAFFNTVLLYGLFFMGMRLTRGAQAAIVVGASPLVATAVAHLMTHDDKFSRRKLTGLLLGCVGVVLVSVAVRPWEPTGKWEFVGLLVLLLSTMVSAIANVVVSRFRKADSGVVLNSNQMVVGGAILLLFGLVTEGGALAPLNFEFWGWLVWLAFVSAAGFGIWFHLLGEVQVSMLNQWKFLIPVAGALLSWALLPGESPDLWAIVGMVLVGVGIVVGQRANRGA